MDETSGGHAGSNKTLEAVKRKCSNYVDLTSWNKWLALVAYVTYVYIDKIAYSICS